MPAVLFVHAHPDDETLATGVSMAHLARSGVPVHLLTMTLGEEGEVIPPELEHLCADREDTLGDYRAGELAGALDVLGVTGHLLGAGDLTGPSYRDSGMVGTPSAAHPAALVNADPQLIAEQVRAVIDRVQAQAVITYDPQGGYGHPDHIATFEATLAAVRGMDRPPLMLSVVTPRSWVLERRAWLADPVNRPAPDRPSAQWEVLPADAPFNVGVVADEHVGYTLIDRALVPVQAEALRSHATQVSVDEPRIALSNDIARLLDGREAFCRVNLDTGELEIPTSGAPAGSLETLL